MDRSSWYGIPFVLRSLAVIPDSLATGLYLATLAVLGVYGLHRVWMVLRFRWPKGPWQAEDGDGVELPTLTVQLPLFNERTVAARLLRSVARLDYPRERLEVQVIDDSTDETREIVDAEAALLRAHGHSIHVIRRRERTGFKAGALAHGLATSKGELVCVFDADFTPEPDFLLRLVGAFRDPRVGMVQARWAHKNRDESLLTRAQSTLLDGHFVVEHTVRAALGLYFNFNGTAGIWRRTAIEDAGGWQHDTLTEDLDLSYRAQLRGWRFVYAPLVSASAEVPSDIAAFKSQQQRWAKGAVQVTRKLAGPITRADVPVRNKLEAFAHLTGNTGYPCVLLLAVLLPLVTSGDTNLPGWWHLAAFSVCTFSVIAFYDLSQRALGRRPGKRLFDVPAAMALGVGMSVSQTRAVLEGLFRSTGEFVRTPKAGDAPRRSRYRPLLRGIPGLELVFAAWFTFGLVRAVQDGAWSSLPFLGIFFLGFLWVGSLSLGGAWQHRRAWRAARGVLEPLPRSGSLRQERQTVRGPELQPVGLARACLDERRLAVDRSHAELSSELGIVRVVPETFPE